MKYLLSILCLFVLSCDNGGDGNQSTCEQIIGEWEFVDIQFKFIEECDEYANFDIENLTEFFVENITITAENDCNNNRVNLSTCLPDSDDCPTNKIITLFSIDGDIMTLTMEDVEIHHVATPEINCFADVTITYERID